MFSKITWYVFVLVMTVAATMFALKAADMIIDKFVYIYH